MAKALIAPVMGLMLVACSTTKTTMDTNSMKTNRAGKPVVYQVFTRLFGNKNPTNKAWGTVAENGVGKFNDFTDTALAQIKTLGVSHIWYTGVPHHALVGDYSAIGIADDDPDVVKGRAGSPYAIKDYYQVNPDLAVDPANRMAEFEALIERTHKHDMQVIIDIVPNHVARGYQSLGKPAGVEDFGALDDKRVEYSKNNNFYYVVGEPFKVPEALNGYLPLGGESHPLVDGTFDEMPAKWTGNGSRKAQPHGNDWYETVKVNFGVTPDGQYDFDRLPVGYAAKSHQQHFEFWQGKTVPDSWLKFRDIAHFWLDKGVDGFRYDMAEMVPVEFWSYLNSSIKMKDPQAFILAEVYNPSLYRDYIHLGKMDYLYDKVEFYDTMKAIIQAKAQTADLLPIVNNLSDIDRHMLHFMENHDEQRINTKDFAGSAEHGKPGMVVSTLMTQSPIMLYFGQEVGESGAEDLGFGDPTRTSIFDYGGVPAHQRWMNEGQFDGGQSTQSERELRQFYQRLLAFSAKSTAVNGSLSEIHHYNLQNSKNYDERQFSFVRWSETEKLIVVSNFDQQAKSYELHLPEKILKRWQLKSAEYPLFDVLSEQYVPLTVVNGTARITITLDGLQSRVLKL